MKPELHYLVWTALLTGALWIPVVIGYVRSRGSLDAEGYRSAPTTKLPDWVNRANRAHQNAIESFLPFAAVVLAGVALGVSTSLMVTAAAVFFFARLAHALVHLSGTGILRARTVLFTVGWCAFMLYAVELLRNMPS